MIRNPTINDVAKLASVSNMTVSRVANGRSNVAEVTREKVLSAMRELSYIPNASAQSMRNDRTRTIGLLLPDISNQTNSVVAHVIGEHLRMLDYRLLIGNTGFSVDIELNYLREFRAGVVDGLILFLANDQDLRTRKALTNLSVPAVLVDREIDIEMDRVLSEHTNSMTEAVEHLIELGHQRIAIIMSPTTMRPGRLRINAFKATMKKHGLPIEPARIVDTRQTVEDGYAAALKILQKDRPTALIVGANQQLFGAIKAIRELGLIIPDDLSLLGADESQASALIEPPITMIERDMKSIGTLAIELLMGKVEQKTGEIQKSILPSVLVKRRSCARPKHRNSIIATP